MFELFFVCGVVLLIVCLCVVLEDFIVEEIFGYDVDGVGEYVLLWVEKCGVNIDWVVWELVWFVEVLLVNVGYVGLKDCYVVMC